MKKVLGLFAVVAMLSATACKKDYTCTCTWDFGGAQEQSYEFTDVKKDDAESSCDAQETSLKLADPDASCSLD